MLPKESMVKLTKVFTLSSALVLKRFCRLGDRQLKAVHGASKLIFLNSRNPGSGSVAV